MPARPIVGIAGAAAGLGVSCFAAAAQQEATACDALADLVVAPEVAITSAERVEDGEMPAHCDVRGTIRGNVGFAVLLPAEWNGRFAMVGNGGKAGELELEDARSRMAEGYAAATTDTGHDNTVEEQSGARFGTDREMEIDFGYRAVHDTATMAQDLVEAHYGARAEYAYWVGCSTGGRQGLMEAQRFPEDFDGYVIGAPVYDYTAQQMTAPGLLRPLYDDDPYTDTPVVSAAKVRRLGDIVYAQCDAVDGVEDGLITDPRACDFSAERDLPACEGDDGDDCFTADEVEAIAAIYEGVTVDGETLVPGLPPGSENIEGGWTSWLVAEPEAPRPPFPLLHTVMVDAFNYLMFEEDRPDYTYMTEFDFKTDPARMDAAAEVFNATDPDLSAAADRGAKMILYHGWGDPGANPLNTIAYHEAVADEMAAQDGAPAADAFLRLYLVPGMAHCRGGIGHDQVDWLAAVRNWVEEGEAPEAIVGTRASDRATRPHCPYPQQAVHSGSGAVTDAGNFACEVR